MKRSSVNEVTANASDTITAVPKNNGKARVPDESLDLAVILSSLQSVRNGDFTVRLPGYMGRLSGKDRRHIQRHRCGKPAHGAGIAARGTRCWQAGENSRESALRNRSPRPYDPMVFAFWSRCNTNRWRILPIAGFPERFVHREKFTPLSRGSRTLVDLGFSTDDAKRLGHQLCDVGALVYVSCPEKAEVMGAIELLRRTGAQEAASLGAVQASAAAA